MVSPGRTGLPATQKTTPSSVELFIVSVLLIVSYEFSPLSFSPSISVCQHTHHVDLVFPSLRLFRQFFLCLSLSQLQTDEYCPGVYKNFLKFHIPPTRYIIHEN